MKRETERLLAQLHEQIAQYAAIEDIAHPWTEKPESQLKFEWEVYEKNALLGQISTFPDQVTESGECYKMSLPDDLLSRSVPTTDVDRMPYKQSSQRDTGWDVVAVDADIMVTYQRLDQWASRPEIFNQQLASSLQTAIANSRVNLGWNGKNRSMTHRPAFDQLDYGWIKRVEMTAPSNIVSAGSHQAGEFRVGDTTGADEKNLHALVQDMAEDIPYQKRKDLRVIMSPALHGTLKLKVLREHGGTPTEMAAAEMITELVGGLVPYVDEFFPAATVMVAPLKMLSLYVHRYWRRQIVDMPTKNAVCYFNQFKQGYAIEDVDCVQVTKNIKLWNSATSAWE